MITTEYPATERSENMSESVRRSQQKSKTQSKNDDDEELHSDQLQGVPDWLQEFKHGLARESVPEHREASSSSHELLSEPRAKVRVSTVFFLLTSRCTEIATSAGEPSIHGLVAEDALVQSCPKRTILVI